MQIPDNLKKKYLLNAEIFNEHESVQITLQSEFSEYMPAPVECTVLCEPESHLERFVSKTDGPSTYQIRASVHGENELWIPKFVVRGFSHSGNNTTLYGIADFLVEGRLKFKCEPEGRVFCFFTIADTPLVTLDKDFDISPTPETHTEWIENTGIVWNTSLGTAELVRTYETSGQTVGATFATLKLRRCQVKLEISTDKFSSVEDLVKKICNSPDTAYWLLSFLDTKHLLWYAADVLYGPSEDKRVPLLTIQRSVYFETEVENQARMGRRQHPADLIIAPKTLANGVFALMLDNLEQKYQFLIKVIQIILTTYEPFYQEAHVGLMYVAFEMFVDVLGKNISETMGTSRFKKLRKRLEDVLDEELGESTEVREAVVEKLSELKRRALGTKLKMLIQEYQMDLTVLWPSGEENIDDELDKLIKRRNLYIHQGRMDDSFVAEQDMRRLRHLIRVWILKLLEGPLPDTKGPNEDVWYAQRSGPFWW